MNPSSPYLSKKTIATFEREAATKARRKALKEVDSTMRQIALDCAISMGFGPGGLALEDADMVARAEKFYQFLVKP